jgi:preprotein translocase subunit SecF
MRILGNTNIDFLKWRWHALALSGAVIIAGLATVTTQGIQLGIDFSGGTAIVVQFPQVVGVGEVRDAIGSVPGDKVVQRFGQADDNEILIRLPDVAGEGQALDSAGNAVLAALEQNLGPHEVLSNDIVGPVIGADLQRKGIYATLTALAGILLYVGFRFRFTFAVGAIIAVFHDILVTLSFLTWFGHELSLNIIAAILTITGYSVNDTIVVFDRVRENQRLLRREPLRDVINRSVNQTLSRTIITSGTTFLAVASLFVLGGEVLRGFSFTMMVGVITGTYSTVFIASAIAIMLSRPQPGMAQAQAKAKARRARA